MLDDLDRGKDLRALSSSELVALASEIRELLVETVHSNGDAGHLASNLGAVELTLALHRVFETPRDKIIWDVGHQAYVHKILTGRKGEIASIRQQGGLSPFPERSESEHDAFGVGHAGTALSAAAGFAIARDLRHENHEIIAVVGDGAMTAGMSFEALNHLGTLGSNVIVVLNDNAMSISPNVGALSRSINRVRVSSAYRDLKVELRNLVLHLPAGKRLWDEASKLKRTSRELLVQAGFWEQFGFDYYGPIDGHDLDVLESTFRSVRHFTGKPALVHILTEKGQGIPEAAADPVKSHSGTYWLKPESNGVSAPTYSEVFGREVIEILPEDDRVVVITPAMLEGSGIAAAREQCSVPEGVVEPRHRVLVGYSRCALRKYACLSTSRISSTYTSSVPLSSASAASSEASLNATETCSYRSTSAEIACFAATRPCGNSSIVERSTASRMVPSATPPSARARSASVSAISRVTAACSSNRRCTAMKSTPVTFQCACLICQCRSTRSARRAFSVSTTGSPVVSLAFAAVFLAGVLVTMLGSSPTAGRRVRSTAERTPHRVRARLTKR